LNDSDSSRDQGSRQQADESRQAMLSQLLGGVGPLGLLFGKAAQADDPAQGASPATIIITNLIPAFCVLFLGWDAFTVVFLYWLENVVVGIFNVARLATAQGQPGKAGASIKFFLIPFFCVHYGLFTFVHGVFVVALLGGNFQNPGAPFAIPPIDWVVWLVLIAFVYEHGSTFYRDFIKSGKYRQTHPAMQMFAPYGRIVVLHLAILGGGFLLVLVGLPRLTVLLLVAFKIVYELAARRIKSLA
jgi:hypothetical protein